MYRPVPATRPGRDAPTLLGIAAKFTRLNDVRVGRASRDGGSICRRQLASTIAILTIHHPTESKVLVLMLPILVPLSDRFGTDDPS